MEDAQHGWSALHGQNVQHGEKEFFIAVRDVSSPVLQRLQLVPPIFGSDRRSRSTLNLVLGTRNHWRSASTKIETPAAEATTGAQSTEMAPRIPLAIMTVAAGGDFGRLSDGAAVATMALAEHWLCFSW
ncbi:hypothetical protein SESBI_20472 [Sesbania bispinosa]|nr:hypothetical protein SESBI_20472 [Sesbania bispinosa]